MSSCPSPDAPDLNYEESSLVCACPGGYGTAFHLNRAWVSTLDLKNFSSNSKLLLLDTLELGAFLRSLF